MGVGDLERRVLEALLADGRAGAAELAAAANVAEATAGDTRRNLEDEGVVLGYRPELDYGRLGYDLTAVFRVTTPAAGRADVREHLASMDQVTHCYEVTGDAGVLAVATFADTRDLDAETRTLLSRPAVDTVSVSVVLQTHVDGRHPPIPVED